MVDGGGKCLTVWAQIEKKNGGAESVNNVPR